MPLFGRRREPSIITRADRAREARQWQLAAGFYRVALDRNPHNPPIWVQYGHALKECGNRAEAEVAYRAAIAYEPQDADAYLQLGHVLKLQGRIAEAKAAYQRALALNGSLADADRELSQLGRSETVAPGGPAPAAVAPPMGSEPLVMAAIDRPARRRLKRGKGSAISRADRARDARQWDIAAELYREALDRNPDNPPIWVQYGHALKESGDLAAAEEAYRAAIAREPAAAEPRLQLGHVLKMRGRREEAQAAYLQALALQPSMQEPLPGLESLGWPAQKLTGLRRIVEIAAISTPSHQPVAARTGFLRPQQQAIDWDVAVPSAEASVVVEKCAVSTVDASVVVKQPPSLAAPLPLLALPPKKGHDGH